MGRATSKLISCASANSGSIEILLVLKLYWPSPTPVPLMPSFWSGNSTSTIPHQVCCRPPPSVKQLPPLLCRHFRSSNEPCWKGSNIYESKQWQGAASLVWEGGPVTGCQWLRLRSSELLDADWGYAAAWRHRPRFHLASHHDAARGRMSCKQCKVSKAAEAALRRQ